MKLISKQDMLNASLIGKYPFKEVKDIIEETAKYQLQSCIDEVKGKREPTAEWLYYIVNPSTREDYHDLPEEDKLVWRVKATQLLSLIIGEKE